MSNSLDLTIVIPTYNGANRLPELLEKLQQQINIETIAWEIIVVDNNSSDDTAQVIRKYQDNWQYPFPLKYYFEQQQGAAYARKKGVEVASGELIGFLDDDNYPTPTWVAAAYNFAQQYPKAGAYGSQIHPDWEVEPPPNFQRISPFLAITERGNQPLFYDPRKKLLPPSAGLVVRRSAWLESIPAKTILTGRVTTNMLTSEDLEMLCYFQISGWEVWYNPEMEIYHRIPASRLKKEYLLPFFRGIGLSRYVTRMLNVPAYLKALMLIAYMINDVRKILLKIIVYRTQIRTDLVTACETELLVSSLISPFYLWKNGYLRKVI